jgi:hypothetical protein
MTATDSSKNTEQSSSKSASATPRSITPAAQHHDEDEGLVLVRLTKQIFLVLMNLFFLIYRIFHPHKNFIRQKSIPINHQILKMKLFHPFILKFKH